MLKYGYLVVEGPHDVEFAYRLLSPSGLSRVMRETDLDPFFGPLIPRKYPPEGDLQRRVAVPLFLKSATHFIAIHSALGDTRLVQTIEENSILIDTGSLTGIGILLDSDDMVMPAERYATVRDRLRAMGFAFPDAAGVTTDVLPRLGAFVLPDNLSQGTLEHLLLECAAQVYPGLLESATAHVERASQDTTLNPDDLKDLRRPAGRNKAIVASIASILRPGRAIQVSLQDNRWLQGAALALPRVHAVRNFLINLFEI